MVFLLGLTVIIATAKTYCQVKELPPPRLYGHNLRLNYHYCHALVCELAPVLSPRTSIRTFVGFGYGSVPRVEQRRLWLNLHYRE